MKMIGKTKHIKFTYYDVVTQTEDGKEVFYDLRKWLDTISKKQIADRIERISNVQGRLETANVIETGYYALNFMRLDEASDAYKAKENQHAEHIDLDADEYLGRNTVAVYDERNHIILIQNNRGSYSANAIQSYVNATNDGKICYFRPILDDFDATRCKKGVIKKIYVKCSATKQFDADGSKAFENIIESCNDLGGYTFSIEIGIGRGKNKQLNNQEIYAAVNTLLRNRGCLSTARIALEDDKAADFYDLFDNLRVGKFDLTVPERGELDYLMLARNMYYQYIHK